MPEPLPLIGRHQANGDPRTLGRALGLAGRLAVHEYLLQSDHWAAVMDPVHAGTLARMANTTRKHFPMVWAELEGLAEGLELPFDSVFAWNCRGDLLASVPDGCTTLVVPGISPMIAHNEDGLPFFRGHCFLFDASPLQGAGFTAFCYPGSLPGHTLAFTHGGMVQTVNNLRLLGVEPDVPRIVLGRAVLDQVGVDEALALLRRYPNSGGFHFILAAPAGQRIASVEFGGGEVSVRMVNTPMIHANHALHHLRGIDRQVITASSAERQRRGEILLEAGVLAPLEILHDRQPVGLPILRLDPDDPDEENTQVTAIFAPGPAGVAWRLYDLPDTCPAHSGLHAHRT